MSIAGRIIVLFLSSGLLLVSIATGYVAQREYEVALDRLATQAAARADQRPELQFAFHRGDGQALDRLLRGFLDEGLIGRATAFTNIGDTITTQGSGPPLSQTISLMMLRSNASVSDTTLVALDSQLNETGGGFWSTLVADKPSVHISTPVFSPVNSGIANPDFANFLNAASSSENGGSLVVIGYVSLALNYSTLMQQVSNSALLIFLIGLGILITGTFPVYLYARKATASITQLNEVASQILLGDYENTPRANPSGDYHEIAKVLNNAIGKAMNRQQEAGLEHKLLLLDAGEKATQLLQTEEELIRATEEIQAAKEELHRLTNYDYLTSLPNRQLFTEQLDLLLRMSTRHSRPLAVLILNIDNFHRINDSIGRSSGDLLLQETANRLIEGLRSSDVLAHNVDTTKELNISRLSGDEFAIVLGDLEDVDSAGAVTERLIEELMKPMAINQHELVAIPKIGIATAPRDGERAEDLMRLATTAMHHARSASGGTYLFYNDDMDDTAVIDIKMEFELRKAIERDELSLEYQPQVDTTTGAVTCAEAYLRWEHPELGQVSPARFIQVAEETGLIWELGNWAIDEVCRQITEFDSRGIDLPRVAVNISPEQIQPAFIERLEETLAKHKLAPQKLELGLSEAILANHDGNMVSFMQHLKQLGVYLSLENFGTSHAPISYLGRYPLDELKVDRSFVSDCDTQDNASRLVSAIVAMSNSLGLPAVAEGVETPGEFQFLSKLGVSKMRGFLFSKPVSAVKLQDVLTVRWHYIDQIQKIAQMDELKSP